MAVKSLTVVEQKTVEFYDDELIAIRASDRQIYVSVRHLCDALGVNRTGQVRRIQRNEILAEGYKGGDIMSSPSAGGRGGGRQKATFLRVDLVPLWLSGIDISRVKEELREKLRRFQREAAKVLWEAFQDGRLTTETDFEQLLRQADDEVAQAYQMALAIVKLARNQVLLQAEVRSNTQRIEQIEATLGDPGQHVTPDQAMQISQAVKAIAIAIGKETKRNEFGAVYGELYRKFGITSYKQLPAQQFQECVNWLTNWHKDMVSDVPF